FKSFETERRLRGRPCGRPAWRGSRRASGGSLSCCHGQLLCAKRRPPNLRECKTAARWDPRLARRSLPPGPHTRRPDVSKTPCDEFFNPSQQSVSGCFAGGESEDGAHET